MSTRWRINAFQTQAGLQTGLEGVDIPDDFSIPSCGIEDVDRAMFKLFNEELPFFYEQDGDMKRIPCVFAGGERALILRRKEPLRDRQGALVLPLVSIMRSGIDQTAEKGIGPGEGTLTIRKRLSEDDRVYKRLVNQQNLRNQQGIKGALGPANTSLGIGHKNVYEVITIPSPRFYKATYEITFWAQYLQQMNSIIEAFISSYNINPALSFKIETDKGYWFVAVVESGLSDSTNFDGYQDDERVIKTSITMSVTGYLINPEFPGAPSPFRRYVSAPKMQFETSDDEIHNIGDSKLPSYDPDSYVFDDMMNADYPLPGPGQGRVSSDTQAYDINIGGIRKNPEQKSLKILHPFTEKSVTATVKSKNRSKGEAVYTIIETLNKE
mgnify:CR=1 FL=1